MIFNAKFPRLSPRLISPRLVAGALLVLLPGAITLLAEDKPLSSKAASQNATATSMNTTAAATQKHEEEEIAKVMEFFKATQPDVYEQALALQGTDPARFKKLVRPVFPMVNRLEDLKKRSPKIFDLTIQDLQHNYQSLRMSKELKKPDITPAEREKLLAELNTVVAEQWNIRMQIRQQEIDDLNQQIKVLIDRLDGNQKEKEAKIKKRVDDLLGKTPKLDW